jgi:hypothetical protein
MRESRADERTGVLVGLGLALILGAIALLHDDLALVVSPAAFVALFVPTAILSAFLRTHLDTWGREGTYVDLWSIVHFLSGVLAYLMSIDLVYVVAIAVAWELIEVVARVQEHPFNRVADLILAMAGWGAIRLFS